MNKEPCEVSIGSDLELLLFDTVENEIVPCVGILEGTKEDPYRPEGRAEGFAIQEDNVMVEFNVPPSHTVRQFTRVMREGKSMVTKELQKRHGDRYALWQRKHNHRFRAEQLTSRQAQTIGCEADFDAYVAGVVRKAAPAPGLMRSAGGHIHLGGDFNCPDFVAALFAELFISIFAEIQDTVSDPRKRWYGKPGIFRPKPYGIEYRTPSNRWGLSVGGIEKMGTAALNCARFLTDTDAADLQHCFRSIPWVSARKYMTANKSTGEAMDLYQKVIAAAYKAGVAL
jgi:hypothetical protein